MYLRISRFRFKDGKEAEGLRILAGHAAEIRAAPGCRDAWLGQGDHPATECVVVAVFDDAGSLRQLEGRLRANPASGGDFFRVFTMTSEPPEVREYEVRGAG